MSRAKKDQKTVTGVFDSIFDQAEFVNAAGIATVVELPLNSLSVNPHQPRKHFAEEELQQLTRSVAAHGILQPIVVRETGMGRYEIVVGERRFRAAGLAGLAVIPAIVRELDGPTTQILALVENLQRADLNPLEETDALLGLLAAMLGKSVDDVKESLRALYDKERGRVRHSAVAEDEQTVIERVFREVGRFTLRSFVTHRLPLLDLPENVLEHVRQGTLDYTKALALSRVADASLRGELLSLAINKRLTLRELQQRVTKAKSQTNLEDLSVELEHRYAALGKRLKKSAALTDTKKRQRIEKLLDQLDKLLT